MRFLKVSAGAAGATILAASTGLLIEANGLTGWHAGLVAAMAAGLVVGAVVIARVSWHVGLVVGLVMLAGEMFGLIGTAERIVISRQAAQAPIAAAAKAHADAQERVRQAALAADDAKQSSPRLLQALEGKARAEAAAREKAAERSCVSNCRALLEGAIASAAADVEAARREMAAREQVAQRELSEARAALAGLPAARSASPLADRLGIEAWLLDVIAASLLAVGANGLAVVLITWAAHVVPKQLETSQSRQSEPQERTAPAFEATPALQIVQQVLPAPIDVFGDVKAFLAANTAEVDGTATPVGVLHSAYARWCAANDVAPVNLTRFGMSLSDCGIEKTRVGGRVMVVGRAPLAA